MGELGVEWVVQFIEHGLPCSRFRQVEGCEDVVNFRGIYFGLNITQML